MPTKFLPDLSDGQAALLQTIMMGGAGLLQGAGQGKENDKDRALTREQMAQQMQRDMLQQQFQGQLAQQQDQFGRDQQAVNASQLDPLAQQRARAAMAFEGDRMNQWTPTQANFDPASGMGSFSGGPMNMRPSEFTKGFYTPEAMANAEYQDFRMPLAHLNPNVATPDLSNVGLPKTKAFNAVELARKGVFDQRESERRLEKDRMARMWEQVNAQATAAPQQQEKEEGTPWWKKALKVAAGVAPLVAAPFTGGASLAMIGAGSGALGGILGGGGVKGALTGAAMGGLTSGAGSLAGKLAGKTAGAALPHIASVAGIPGAMPGQNVGSPTTPPNLDPIRANMQRFGKKVF
jgi:hypothetical protein